MRILKTVGALVVIAMISSSVVAYSILRRADATGELVLSSHRTLEAAEETLRRVLDSERSVRRYAETRDVSDLAPFVRAEQAFPRTLDDLEEHVGGDPERLRVRALRADVHHLFDEWRVMVGRLRGSAGAMLDAHSDVERRIDAVRAVIRDLRRSENDRLADRMRADARASRSLGWVVVVTAAIAAALGTGTAAMLVFFIRPGWSARG